MVRPNCGAAPCTNDDYQRHRRRVPNKEGRSFGSMEMT